MAKESEISNQIPIDLTGSTTGINNSIMRAFIGTSLAIAGSHMIVYSSDWRVQAAGGLISSSGYAINIKMGQQFDRARNALRYVKNALRRG
jgi:hypothetical protein